MLALQRLRADARWHVAGLITTAAADGLAHSHYLRPEILSAQANALGLPLYLAQCSDDSAQGYNHAFSTALELARSDQPQLAHIAFGDILLQDVRDWRVQHVASLGCEALFPLWGESTRELAEQIISSGHRVVLVSVDTTQLDARFCGRDFDRALLRELPSGVDPCGENGEFHSLCHDSPCFSAPLRISLEPVQYRDDGRFATAAVRLRAPAGSQINR